MDKQLIGGVINALPIGQMVAAPLNAMISAQVAASKQYADFLLSVCFQERKTGNRTYNEPVNLKFDYDETLVDGDGKVLGVQKRHMKVPLLAAVTHPNVCVESGSVDFELEVSQAESSSEETDASANLQATLGWSFLKVSMSGKVSHKKEQTRSTDTRAKYSFHVDVKRQPPPEGLMLVMEALVKSATSPVILTSEDVTRDPDEAAKAVMDAPGYQVPKAEAGGTQ